MTETTESWLKKTLRELQKHAEKDERYKCKQLLKTPFVQAFLKAITERELSP